MELGPEITGWRIAARAREPCITTCIGSDGPFTPRSCMLWNEGGRLSGETRRPLVTTGRAVGATSRGSLLVLKIRRSTKLSRQVYGEVVPDLSGCFWPSSARFCAGRMPRMLDDDV